LLRIRRGVGNQILRLRRVVARATSWPLTVRLTVFLAALAAGAFTCPPELLAGPPAMFIMIAALLPALWPRSLMVTAFWLVTALAWLATTTLYAGSATLPRLIGVTVALYLLHTGAALAAVLPYDAVVSATVVVRWVLRAGLTLVPSVGLVVFGLFETVRLGTHTYLAATVVGLALTVCVAWLLASVAARRRSR
jgi:hypothetical protein